MNAENNATLQKRDTNNAQSLSTKTTTNASSNGSSGTPTLKQIKIEKPLSKEEQAKLDVLRKRSEKARVCFILSLSSYSNYDIEFDEFNIFGIGTI
jgi:hypothetical protein